MATHLITSVIVVAAADEALSAARAAGATLIELRADLIGDATAIERLLVDKRAAGKWILTIRRADEGGAWDGDEDERISLFERLGLAQPGWIDVEFAAWERSANIRQKIGLVAAGTQADSRAIDRPRGGLILSLHDLRGTPEEPELSRRLAEIRRARPAVAKIVTTARDGVDAFRVLSLLAREAGEGPLIALAMGEAGLMTRVLAPKFGAWGNFAAPHRGGESAPGQVTIAELRGRYRYDSITPATRVFGVLGWPVRQSKSPRIHNAAMAHDGVDGVYVPIPIEPDRARFIEFMTRAAEEPALGFDGFSVTIPHKEHALEWLDQNGGCVSRLARRCGAVNTLIRDADGWRGENTDATGAWSAIAPCFDDKPAADRTALLLGAGGVARAVATALLDRGFDVTVVNRTDSRATLLAAALGCRSVAWSQRPDLAPALIVNCTSVGMWPNVAETPLAASALRPGCIVFDTIYNPGRTRLLRDAAAVGCVTISGVEMFLAQAAAQYELWHGCAAPLDVMREALA